ncbi:MAG: type II secretion system F family protein [Acidimicrobiia bacterium]
MIILAALGIFAGVFVIIATVLFAGDERREVRKALSRLDYSTDNVREAEMLASIKDRVLVPAMAGLAKLSGRFTPAGYVGQIRHKLVLAGNPAGLDADRFVAIKLIAALSGPIWALLVFVLGGFSGFYGTIMVGLLWAISFFAPDSYIRRKQDERQHEIAIRLPDILDLLVISVEAGLGFEQAIDRTIAAVPGPLSEEFGRMLKETRVGSSRAEALRAMDERTEVPELRSFILAMLQADTFGVSIGRLLRAQADEMRVRRRQRAQELAQKAPVKMLFPLIFCIFPSLFVVILGPAAIQIARNLG